MKPSIRSLSVLLASLLSSPSLLAGPFTTDNLVVLRVGDGSAALGSTAAPVGLVEYTTASGQSSPVQVISVDATAAGLTLTGTSTTQGILSRSVDTSLLTFAGFRKAAGGTNPQSDTTATTNRVLGYVNAAGTVNVATAVTDGFSADAVRAAATVDGSSFYLSGAGSSASGGVRYIASPGSAGTSITINNGNSGNPNMRQISILGGQLFGASGASNPGTGLHKIGAGIPTTGPQTYTASITTAAQIQAFYFTNLGSGNNWSSTGFDTVYTADGTNLAKWSFNGTSWVASGSVAVTGLACLTGTTNGGNVTLYGTTNTASTGILFSLSDASGAAGTLTGTPTTLATAGTNFAFRGVAFAPVSVASNAELSISSFTVPATANTGANFDYTINVNNSGTVNATGVAVEFTLPAGLSFVSASGSGFTSAHASGIVSFTGGTINASSSTTLTVTVNTNTAATYTASIGAVVVDPANTITENNEGNNASTTAASTIISMPNTPPSFTAHPANVSIANGATTTLTSAATGSPAPTFQWYVGSSGDTNNPIGGAINASFTTPALIATTSYWVRATNTINTADSNTAIVTVAPSTNADLSGLTISPGVLNGFTASTTSLNAYLASSTTSFTITPTAAHSGATITVNGASNASGAASNAISINVGANTINVVVTAQDGTTTKTYTLNAFRSAPALSAGSIAFTGFNADSTDDLAFAALTAIPENSVIFFSDNEWNGQAIGAGGAFNDFGESELVWIAPPGGVTAGSIVVINSVSGTTTTNIGTVGFSNAANRGYSTTAEAVYAYQGSTHTPEVFHAQVSTDAAASIANTGLTVGTTAISLIAASDGGAYVGSRTNQLTVPAYGSQINTLANWTDVGATGDGTTLLPFNTTAFSVAPPIQTVTVIATDASAAEAVAPNTGTFRISRSGDTTNALNVSYTLATGTGRAVAADFTPALSGTAVINATESFTDITITPVDDLLLEGDETVELTITDTVDYDLGATVTASVTITENDLTVNLANYVRVGRFDLPEPTRTSLPPGTPASNLLCQEASAVTYNWDTDSLFITGDGGRSITQVSKTGVLIDTMTLALGSSPQGTDFYDPEGLTYIGGGQFVMSEERDRQLVKFTYAAGTTLSRTSPGVQTVKIGTFVDNTGTEGLSWDPQTSGFIVLKEITPMGIFQTGVDFNAGTATNGSPTTVNSTNLFDPALLGMTDTADVFALSNLTALNGQAQAGNMLVLSQENARVVNVDRSGNIHSTLNIQSDVGNPLTPAGQQHEGITMDSVGNIYIVNENGGGSIDYPQLWVYSPSAVPNQPASAVAVSNGVTSIMENTSTAARIKVGDIVVTDDGLGTNTLSISGTDAASFELTGTELFLKAGVVLDFETKTSYSISIDVDDSTVGGAPDVSASFTLNVQDQVVETPPAAVLVITEVAPWSSSNSPGILADWFELTNVSASAVTLTGYKMDDNSFGFGTSVALNGITTIAPGESVIFIETADLPGKTTAFINTWFGGSAPVGLQIGSYTGSGVGLSSSGDGVIVFNAAGTEQCRVTFGASAGPTYRTFDNTLAHNNVTVSLLSQAGVNGAFAAAANANEVGSPGYSAPGVLRITEVAPWGSGNSPYLADWFEVTNIGGRAVDMTGWKMDDSSESPAAAAALTGIVSIAPGESVIYLETATPATTINSFRSTWFGASPPVGLQVGSYTGSGIGLSTGSDAVNLFDSNNVRQAKVFFGASTSSAPFKTFDNSLTSENTSLTQFSAIGYNGAFAGVNDANEIGSPGIRTIATPVNTWRQTYFGSSANSGNAADTADFDGDGVNNLLEYALGANPANGNGDDGIAALPVGISGSASDQPLLQDRLYLSFSIPQTAPADVTYTVQASDSLGTWTDVARKVGTGAWTWLDGGTARLYTSVQAPYELVQVGDLAPRDNNNTRRFMRLQVSAP